MKEREKRDLLGLTYNEIETYTEENFGRGAYHSRLLFHNIYNKGVLEADLLSPILQEECQLRFPRVGKIHREGETVKFLLELENGLMSESVILPMENYNTLCLSSQIGCRWGCVFCETGKMGIIRNLTAGEIMAQYLTATLHFKKKIRNIVFMGMGEPFDNFDNLISAIDILTDPKGCALFNKSICISTVGNIEGIERFTTLAKESPQSNYGKVHLAVSLNGATDHIRSSLMPVNRRWPIKELMDVLKRTPQFGKKNLLYFEYVLIHGITDGEVNGKALIALLKDFPRLSINLIPYNPGLDSVYKKPTSGEISRFHSQLLGAGLRIFIRFSQGEEILGGCGQLGNQIESPPVI